MAELTKGDNDGAGDAVGHYYSEDAHHPGIGCPELKLIGLVLYRHNYRIKRKSKIPFSQARSSASDQKNINISNVMSK